MSITTALKKLAKNVFDVDATGNNIDEILDNMTFKVTPGSGGGGDSGIATFKLVVEPSDDLDAVRRAYIDAPCKDVVAAAKIKPVLFIGKYNIGLRQIYAVATISELFEDYGAVDGFTRINIAVVNVPDMSQLDTTPFSMSFYADSENTRPDTSIPDPR